MLAYIKIEIDNKIDELNLQEYEKEEYKKEVVQEYLDEYGLSEYEAKLDEMLQSQAECYDNKLRDIEEIVLDTEKVINKAFATQRLDKTDLKYKLKQALKAIYEIASDR